MISTKHSLLKKTIICLLCAVLAIMFATVPSANTAQADESEEQSSEPCAAVGSTISWTTTQMINTLGVNAFNRYTAMEFTDYLPSGIEYTGIKVLSEGGQDVTDAAGESAYSAAQHAVKYRFFDDWLATLMTMKGETYSFVVYGRVCSIPEDNNYRNRSIVRINNLTMQTNKTSTNIVKPAMNVEMLEPEGYVVLSDASGDVVDYRIRITQTEPGAAIRDVKLKDIVPTGMELKSNSIHVEDTDGDPISFTTDESEDGFTVAIERIEYNKPAIVRYQCASTSTTAGESFDNVISTTAAGIDETNEIKHSIYICDNELTRDLTIDKCINASDLSTIENSESFVFNVYCEDYNGNSHTYRTIAAISSNSEIDEEGFAHATCELKGLPAGMYKITEISPLRFPPSEIESDNTNLSIEENSARINLVTQENAKCSFKSSKAYSKNPTCSVCMVSRFPGGSK